MRKRHELILAISRHSAEQYARRNGARFVGVVHESTLGAICEIERPADWDGVSPDLSLGLSADES